MEQKIIRECVRARMPLPKRIADAPQLQLGLELYYDAFWDLSTCRALGFGMGPIPWSSMLEYAVVHEFDEEQREALFQHIRAMDNAFLTFEQKKGKKK